MYDVRNGEWYTYTDDGTEDVRMLTLYTSGAKRRALTHHLRNLQVSPTQ